MPNVVPKLFVPSGYMPFREGYLFHVVWLVDY